MRTCLGRLLLRLGYWMLRRKYVRARNMIEVTSPTCRVKLGDATYCDPISHVYGEARVQGTIIWSSDAKKK